MILRSSTFEYPITAIAGKNGAGKSTILALACCAFHNGSNGFKLPKRSNTYYTFSDFFVQHSGEVPPQGLAIHYFIAHNNWRKTPERPDVVRVGMQVRKKIKGGKWNDYATRVPRTDSKEIFDCLPADARFFVESVNGKTRVTQGISSDFAFSKISSITGLELDIFLEDEVAKAILLAALPAALRSRLTFTVIGSATALARQLAALYVRGEKKPVLAIFDGDQRSKAGENRNHAEGKDG